MIGRLLTAAALLLVLATPGSGQHKDKGKEKHKDKPGKAKVEKIKGGDRFTEADVRIIREHYRRGTYRLKPLPPGIVKKLERGRPLPPGLAKKYLPREVVVLLPPRPGFEYVLAGDMVVLLDRGGLVVDLVGVFH